MTDDMIGPLLASMGGDVGLSPDQKWQVGHRWKPQDPQVDLSWLPGGQSPAQPTAQGSAPGFAKDDMIGPALAGMGAKFGRGSAPGGDHPRYDESDSGADVGTRMAVGAVESQDDKLAALRKRMGNGGIDADGNMFFTDKSGKVHKYQGQGMSSWLGDIASLVPEVGETVGAVLGGIGGAAVGAPSGPGALVSAMAGAGAGGALGHKLTQKAVQTLFGVDDTRDAGEQFADVLTHGALDAGGELIGPALRVGGRALGQMVRPLTVGADAGKAFEEQAAIKAATGVHVPVTPMQVANPALQAMAAGGLKGLPGTGAIIGGGQEAFQGATQQAARKLATGEVTGKDGSLLAAATAHDNPTDLFTSKADEATAAYNKGRAETWQQIPDNAPITVDPTLLRDLAGGRLVDGKGLAIDPNLVDGRLYNHGPAQAFLDSQGAAPRAKSAMEAAEAQHAANVAAHEAAAKAEDEALQALQAHRDNMAGLDSLRAYGRRGLDLNGTEFVQHPPSLADLIKTQMDSIGARPAELAANASEHDMTALNPTAADVENSFRNVRDARLRGVGAHANTKFNAQRDVITEREALRINQADKAAEQATSRENWNAVQQAQKAAEAAPSAMQAAALDGSRAQAQADMKRLMDSLNAARSGTRGAASQMSQSERALMRAQGKADTAAPLPTAGDGVANRIIQDMERYSPGSLSGRPAAPVAEVAPAAAVDAPAAAEARAVQGDPAQYTAETQHQQLQDPNLHPDDARQLRVNVRSLQRYIRSRESALEGMDPSHAAMVRSLSSGDNVHFLENGSVQSGQLTGFIPDGGANVQLPNGVQRTLPVHEIQGKVAEQAQAAPVQAAAPAQAAAATAAPERMTVPFALSHRWAQDSWMPQLHGADRGIAQRLRDGILDNMDASLTAADPALGQKFQAGRALTRNWYDKIEPVVSRINTAAEKNRMGGLTNPLYKGGMDASGVLSDMAPVLGQDGIRDVAATVLSSKLGGHASAFTKAVNGMDNGYRATLGSSLDQGSGHFGKGMEGLTGLADRGKKFASFQNHSGTAGALATQALLHGGIGMGTLGAGNLAALAGQYGLAKAMVSEGAGRWMAGMGLDAAGNAVPLSLGQRIAGNAFRPAEQAGAAARAGDLGGALAAYTGFNAPGGGAMRTAFGNALPAAGMARRAAQASYSSDNRPSKAPHAFSAR